MYRVSEEEIGQILAFVRGLDLDTLADSVLQLLFDRLEAYFECDFSDVHPNARSGTQVE